MNFNQLIDGRKLAQRRQASLAQRLVQLTRKPTVVSILIGDDLPSLQYTEMKQQKAQELGINFQLMKYPKDEDFSNVALTIVKLNQDPSIDGIMIQLPVPDEFLKERSVEKLLNVISPQKDIDGLNEESTFIPAAVRGIISIFEDEQIPIKDEYIVVIGAGRLVGAPLAEELKRRGAMVGLCDENTPNIPQKTKKADAIICATGVPGILTGDMITEGVVVIDAGSGKVGDKIMGDVDFKSVSPLSSKITPVPGGVGPMTIISLMENIVDAIDKPE